MIKKLMQLRNTIVALLGIEFVLVLLTYMFLQNSCYFSFNDLYFNKKCCLYHCSLLSP